MASNKSNGLAQFDLNNQTVIVTGGGYGLGKAMAQGLASAGANVVIAGRTQSKLQDTENEINSSGGNAISLTFDATDKASCETLISHTVERFGHIHSMVINHGVVSVAAPEDLSEAAWNEVISTNLSGCFFCAQAVGRQMIKQKSGGAVVMISSNGSLVGFDGLSAYGASKGGVDQLCRQLAMEWGQYNIRVNAVNPGYTTNSMSGRYEVTTTPELEAEIKKMTPLQRRGEPDDFVGPVIFLCSDASRFVSGHCLVVDGGYCAV